MSKITTGIVEVLKKGSGRKQLLENEGTNFPKLFWVKEEI
jgi:hypothetical protein